MLAVLVSGTGSLLAAMLSAGVPVGFVLADRPCRGIDIAAENALAHLVIPRTYGDSFDREAYTREVVEELISRQVTLIAMAGYKTVLGRAMFGSFEGRIVNTHPSLLPLHKGAHAVASALQAGDAVTGCTIHVATIALDDGPILAQATVPILPGDTEATLHERIKVVERDLYPKVVKKLLAEQT